MPFIRAIRVEEPGTRTEHVLEVLVSDFTTSRTRTVPVEHVYLAIRRGARYRTFDERTGRQADVQPRSLRGGLRRLTTVQAGIETDDLLQLPRYDQESP